MTGPRVEHRPGLGPSDGEPGGWTVVCASPDSVTVMAMCACGDQDCAFTATVYSGSFEQLPTS